MPAAVGGADFGSGPIALAKKFCLTGSASMLAEGATFPVDITKTRLQLQGQADFTGSKLVRAPALEPMRPRRMHAHRTVTWRVGLV